MSTQPGGGVIELTAEQTVTVIGAANAIIDAIDHPYMEIEDQFDPVRRIHLRAARADLRDHRDRLAPDGQFQTILPPSQVQALRDAVGAIEVMVTPPVSERLLQLNYRPDENDLSVLGGVLDGLPPVNREDLAFSDFRFGGDIDVLRDRTPLDDYQQAVREVQETGVALPGARMVQFHSEATGCRGGDDRLVKRIAAHAFQKAEGREVEEPDLESALRDELSDTDCYSEMDRRRIMAGFERAVGGQLLQDRVPVHVFGIVEMFAWADSNRQRRSAIGL